MLPRKEQDIQQYFYTRNRVLTFGFMKKLVEGFECDYNIYWCESGARLQNRK